MKCYVEGIPIFYQEYGKGVPIVCLHGFPEDHKSLTGCLEPIFQSVEGYRRIYIDLPGMGKSGSNKSIKNADDMLKVLKTFIDTVIKEENFLLIGQSYGGYLSLGLTLQLKKKIDGMLLICPCVVADKEKREIPQKRIIEYDEGFTDFSKEDKDFNDFMEYAVVATKGTWKRYKNEVLPGLLVANKSFTKKYQKEGYGFSFDVEINNLTFDKPTCILLGRQDNCVGYMDTLKLIDNFSRATFVVLDAAGHNLQLERSKLFEANVIDWLARIRTV